MTLTQWDKPISADKLARLKASHDDCACTRTHGCEQHKNPNTHYIGGWGERGCLYDTCTVHRTYLDAVEHVADTFGLGRTRKGQLKRDRRIDLKPRDGAAYAEIVTCTCEKPWEHDENITREDWLGLPRFTCNQCQALMINGVFCHETGCPNTKARWDEESGEWVKQRVCWECGFTVDEDDPCCSAPCED